MIRDRVILLFFQTHAIIGVFTALGLFLAGYMLVGVLLVLLSIVSFVGWIGVYGPVITLEKVTDGRQ